MLRPFAYTALVTVLSLLVYLSFLFKVGGARVKYNTPAPATDGPPEFQRIFRVQMNTVEQLVWFLPSLWLFAVAWGDPIAAAIGVFWPIGRLVFARGYYVAPEKRSAGFGISFLSAAILLLGAIVGVVMALI